MKTLQNPDPIRNLPCIGPDGRPMSTADYEALRARLDRQRDAQHPLLVRKAGSRGPWKLVTGKSKPRAPARRAPRRSTATATRPSAVASAGDDPPGPPLLVHQRTALAVLGFTPRAFLAIVKRLAIPHTVVRRLTLCRLADVLAALGLAPPPAAPAPEPRVPWQERARLRLIEGGKGRAS